MSVGYDPLGGKLTYAIEAKPLPAGANGLKRPINTMDPVFGGSYSVDEPSDDDEMAD